MTWTRWIATLVLPKDFFPFGSKCFVAGFLSFGTGMNRQVITASNVSKNIFSLTIRSILLHILSAPTLRMIHLVIFHTTCILPCDDQISRDFVQDDVKDRDEVTAVTGLLPSPFWQGSPDSFFASPQQLHNGRGYGSCDLRFLSEDSCQRFSCRFRRKDRCKWACETLWEKRKRLILATQWLHVTKKQDPRNLALLQDCSDIYPRMSNLTC